MSHTKNKSGSPRFMVEDKVRVKYGVIDPDYPDIPLGGWTGTVTGVEQTDDEITYEIKWDKRTIRGMHPVYRKRCERDGLELETMWLGQEEIEPDDGASAPIEQPTEIKTPPLSEKDQDDRVRMALGLTHDDPLPDVSLEALRTYDRYLRANLKFPFNAYYGEAQVGQFAHKRASIAVSGLLDPVRAGLGEEDGLFCKGRRRGEKIEVPLAEIEVGKKSPNLKLISDYAYWFHNWPRRDEGDIDWEDDGQDDPYGARSEVRPPGPWLLTKAVLACGVGGGILGATIGAAFKTFDGAGLAALIGGIPLGTIGALMLGRYGIIFGAVNRLRFGAFLGAVLGSLGGGLVGVVAGLTVLALPWSLLGLIAGLFLGPYGLRQKPRRLVSFRAAALGTCGGVLMSAFRHDQGRATAGAVSGAVTGLVAAAGLVLLVIGAVYLIPRKPMGFDEQDEVFEKVEEEDEDHGGGLRLRRF